MKIPLKWFKINSLKSNPENFQPMVLSVKTYCKHVLVITQLAITCSKLTIETLEQSVKCVQS